MTEHAQRAEDANRLEQVLGRLDSLPTLGAIAVRLLTVTADADSCADDVSNIISADPSLAAKVLRMCAVQ